MCSRGLFSPSLLSRALLSVLLGACLPAFAQQLEVGIEIPRLKVAEYHRPYVAAWIETPGGGVVANLAVWYDTELRDREGEKWLKDMRQWWRRSGRSLEMPVDGVSGATRAPGHHTLRFRPGEEPLGQMTEGAYQLRVEAAREVGGRELVSIPFSWPPSKPQTLQESGERELGKIELQLRPGS